MIELITKKTSSQVEIMKVNYGSLMVSVKSNTLKIQIGRNDPLTMVVLPRNSNNRFLGNSNCG